MRYWVADFGCAPNRDVRGMNIITRLYAWRDHSAAGVLDTVSDILNVSGKGSGVVVQRESWPGLAERGLTTPQTTLRRLLQQRLLPIRVLVSACGCVVLLQEANDIVKKTPPTPAQCKEWKAAQEAADKQKSDKPADKPAEKQADKPADKPAEKPAAAATSTTATAATTTTSGSG